MYMWGKCRFCYYLYVCACVCMYVCLWSNTLIQRTSVICGKTYMRVYMHVSTYVCMYMRCHFFLEDVCQICTHTHVCTYTRTHIHTHTHVHTHTHTRTHTRQILMHTGIHTYTQKYIRGVKNSIAISKRTIHTYIHSLAKIIAIWKGINRR
jgi:hypothetical protein